MWNQHGCRLLRMHISSSKASRLQPVAAESLIKKNNSRESFRERERVREVLYSDQSELNGMFCPSIYRVGVGKTLMGFLIGLGLDPLLFLMILASWAIGLDPIEYPTTSAPQSSLMYICMYIILDSNYSLSLCFLPTFVFGECLFVETFV